MAYPTISTPLDKNPRFCSRSRDEHSRRASSSHPHRKTPFITSSTLAVLSQTLDSESYVYWTVHHLDSWIKRDQLDFTCFLFHYLMLNMFRMLIHPSSGACDLFVELFHGLYCSGSMCVGVTLWFGWRLQPASGYHTTQAKPHRNTNTNRTRAIQPMK